jgi:WD40 repeat protein
VALLSDSNTVLAPGGGDGTILYTLGDGVAELLDTEAATPGADTAGPAAFRSAAVAVSPDGKTFAGGYSDEIWLFDRQAMKHAGWIRDDGGTGKIRSIHSIDFSHDGKRIVFCGGSVEVMVADVATQTVVLRLEETRSSPVAVFSPDDARIAVATRNSVRLFDAKTGQAVKKLVGHGGDVTCVAYNSAGSRIVTGGSDTSLRLWDSEAGEEILTLRGHEKSVFSIAVSPDGRRLASADSDGTIIIWDSETGQRLLTISDGGRTVGFAPDGKKLVGIRSGDVRVLPAAFDSDPPEPEDTSDPASQYGGDYGYGGEKGSAAAGQGYGMYGGMESAKPAANGSESAPH